MNKMIINTIHRDAWTKRWKELHDNKFKNDYLIAELACEIRNEFPKGDAGDFQFGQWVKQHLQGARPKILLERVRGYETFSETEWRRLGGWPGVSLLLTWKKGERAKVLAALHGPGPFHYSTIRVRALSLGIVAKRERRDTRSRSEGRVETLRSFIIRLYRDRSDLPPLPENVKKAMTKTVLSEIPADVRA